MTKRTADGVFTVYIASDGLAPEHANRFIAGESLEQLVALLEGLAQTIRRMAGPQPAEAPK